MSAPPINAFELRCQARALLWHVGEYELAEAVDVLQADAERCGLVAEFGQDRVQQIMPRPFDHIERARRSTTLWTTLEMIEYSQTGTSSHSAHCGIGSMIRAGIGRRK
jgi:hypothetical protein